MVANKAKGMGVEGVRKVLDSFILGKLAYTLIPLCAAGVIREEVTEDVFRSAIRKGLGISRTAICNELYEKMGVHKLKFIVQNFRQLLVESQSTQDQEQHT